LKQILCAFLLVGLLVLPGLGITEGDDTVQLARTLYTLGRDESYETLLMLGSVVMNRVESPWYPDTVQEVLGEPHQFPRGMRYDDRSLNVARKLMMGYRALPSDVLYYSVSDASIPPNKKVHSISGNYTFYLGDR